MRSPFTIVRILAVASLLGVSTLAHSQESSGGSSGDSNAPSSPPQIWITTPSENGGTVVTPGYGQPVETGPTSSGQPGVSLNYDTEPATNSVPVIIPDSPSSSGNGGSDGSEK